jgi:hypothetical protein
MDLPQSLYGVVFTEDKIRLCLTVTECAQPLLCQCEILQCLSGCPDNMYRRLITADKTVNPQSANGDKVDLYVVL